MYIYRRLTQSCVVSKLFKSVLLVSFDDSMKSDEQRQRLTLTFAT